MPSPFAAWPRNANAGNFATLNAAFAYFNTYPLSNLTTLTRAFAAVGFNNTYGNAGPTSASSAITFFAPVESAWASFLHARGLTVSDLLADVSGLKALLQYHMIDVALPYNTLLASSPLITLAGLSYGYVMPQKNQ